tara:strand:- start:47 stop:448 length:402 start_codon:yes stop_codon:yes gene_type:complete
MKKVDIGGRKVPKKYVPDILSAEDKLKQIKSIKEGTKRPKLKSFKSKRSNHVEDFEKKYGHKISDYKWISKNLLKMKGIKKVLQKGRAAYYTSGSRPNTTSEAWARARLASMILGRGARKVDIHIWEKYRVRK